MPEMRGTVKGRVHNARGAAARPRISWRCRHWMKFDEWERQLVIEWTRQGVGVETIARRLLRPVAQIVAFDPVRPNGRRA